RIGLSDPQDSLAGKLPQQLRSPFCASGRRVNRLAHNVVGVRKTFVQTRFEKTARFRAPIAVNLSGKGASRCPSHRGSLGAVGRTPTPAITSKLICVTPLRDPVEQGRSTGSLHGRIHGVPAKA